MFVFLFVFCTVADFSAAEIDTSVKSCTRVRLLSRPVFSHFGGQRSKVKVTMDKKARLALPRPTRLAYERYALAATVMQQQRAAAADERIYWRPRGDGVQRCSLGIRNYARCSAGIRNWGRRRRLSLYGVICVLQAC